MHAYGFIIHQWEITTRRYQQHQNLELLKGYKLQFETITTPGISGDTTHS